MLLSPWIINALQSLIFGAQIDSLLGKGGMWKGKLSEFIIIIALKVYELEIDVWGIVAAFNAISMALFL